MGLRNSIKQALEGRYFDTAVDLGCGPGRFGEILKPHVRHLIGVDHRYGRINVAVKFSGYDEGIWSEVQDYELPPETEAVFMFELIEHLSEQDGRDLLNRISHIPFVIISTPATFFKSHGLSNHHVSLWTPEEFTNLGFKVKLINYDFPQRLIFRMDCVFAVKGGETS